MTVVQDAARALYERAPFSSVTTAPAKDGPTPFIWRNPDELPRRQFLYSTILIRKEVSATLAPGGVGKTTLGIMEALALASSKPLLGVAPVRRCKVWLWNGEEPVEEMNRRIMAACKHHRITKEDIDGYLFVNTAETMSLVIAEETVSGVKVSTPIVGKLVAWLKENEIDVLFIDPFISTHSVNENDNNAIQKATSAWKDVAQQANVAIGIAHHTRKLGDREATAEDSRGAKSFTDKCRVVRVLNPMTNPEADRFGIDRSERRSYFSFDPSEMKANMSAAVGTKNWFKTIGVSVGKLEGNLDPGDSVAVVTPWVPPSMNVSSDLSSEEISAIKTVVGSGSYREAKQSPLWVGNVIASACGLDVKKAIDKKRATAILNKLVSDRVLKIVEKPDEQRHLKKFVVVAIPTVADADECVTAAVEVTQH